MTDSILNSTKKLVGVDESYTAFDLDIMTHINSVFLSLTQLGIGPVEGYMITGPEAVWGDFYGPNVRLNAIRTYVALRVRVVFDPPTSSFVLTALQEQIRELEWRLSVQRETEMFPVIKESDDPDYETVIDGGRP